MPIAGSSPARSAILETTLRGGLLFSYASGPRAGRGFWHGRTCTGQRDCPARGFSFSQRLFVVDLFGGGQPAFLLTQLAQRVLLDVPVPDALPGAAIPTAYSRVTVVLLVAFGFRFGVLLAEPAIRQLGASGVRTGALGFCWHRSTSFRPRKFRIVRFRASTKSSLTSLLVLFPQSRLCGSPKKQSHRRGGPTMASLDSLGNFNDTLRSYSHSIHRTLMFPGGREIPAAPSRADGKCAEWSSPCPRRSSPRA